MPTTSLKDKIRHSVVNIQPFDSIEKAHIDFVIEWLDSGALLFRTEKPATPPTHLVSYFLIFSPDQSKVLLVDHKKALLWLPTGGHVEPEEDPKEAVIREAHEELGIQADFLCENPLFVTVTKTVGNVLKHIDVSLWYILKCSPNELLAYDESEFNQIRWFELDEIPYEQSDPHLRRFIEKIMSNNSFC